MTDCFDDPVPATPDARLAETFGPALTMLSGARLSNAPKTRGERIAWAQTLHDLRQDLTAEMLLTAARRHLNSPPAADGSRFWPTPSDLSAHLPPAPMSDGAAWDRLYSRACQPLSMPAVEDERTKEEARSRAWEAIVGRFDPAQRDAAARLRAYLRGRDMSFAALTPEQAAELRAMFIARVRSLREGGLDGPPQIAIKPEHRVLPPPVPTPEEDRVSAQDWAALRDRAPKRPDPERAKRLSLIAPLKREEEEAVLAELRAYQQRKGGE